MLSDSEASDANDDTHQLLTINETFAKAYKVRKEREELAKLKEKYGSDVDEDNLESEDSEEDTTEDEQGEELTPALDAAILRTLARIKRKDPEIYDAGKDVFEEEQRRSKGGFSFNAKKSQGKQGKPLHIRQHVLESTLRENSRSPSPGPQKPTHVQEQAALRKELISAFHTAVDGPDDQEEDDLLIPREKTKDEIEEEQEEYRRYLEQEVGEDIGNLVEFEVGPVGLSADDDERKDATSSGEQGNSTDSKKKRKKKGGKSREERDHEFLMNYILHRGWVDHSAQHVPTFDEITEQDPQVKRKGENHSVDGNEAPHEDLSEEEEFDDVVDTFESVYNFRYEEPDAGTIPTHPRSIVSTVRREENPRKVARERKKERKEEKMLQKREEVKRLKSLKMKEIREKLERIGKEGGKGADDEALAQLDLDADWDPDAHDKQMDGLYGNELEEDGEEDLEKPTWDDDIDIADIVPVESEGPSSSKKSKKKKKGKNEDKDGEVGVDIDEMDADTLSHQLAAAKSSKVDKKVLDEAMDNVYGLEFNDIVGGIATRFKYTPVLPQNYGMSAAEILLAEEADLNNVVGLRALAPYRRDKGRTWDNKRGEKLGELKRKLKEKGAVEDALGGGEDEKVGKKRKGKKERMKEKKKMGSVGEVNGNFTIAHEEGGGTVEGVEDDELPKKKRRRKHKGNAVVDQ